jgi:membrane protein involved in colicin uptake
MIKTCSKCKIENECRKGRAQCKYCEKQYYEANKSAIAEKGKQYREANKESIAEKGKQYRQANKKAIAEWKKQYQQSNKEAIAEKKKQWQQANKKAIKQYQQSNKEAIAEKGKQYRQANKKDIAEKKKQYREANKEVLAEKKKQYREANKKAINKRFNNRLKTDPIFKFKHNVRTLIYQSFKRGNNNFRKNTKTEQILGCTIEEFRKYIQAKFKKGMSFDNHGQWHLDHIVPLSIAATEEEIIKLNHYTNFQPLWAEENLSKSDKIIETQLMLI